MIPHETKATQNLVLIAGSLSSLGGAVRSQSDVAAWGLFEKRDVNSLSRVVSARTLDGYKIRAKLALSYPRPLLPSEAEEVMMKYARAYASLVECELSNGNLPWDDRELLDRVVEKVTDLPKSRIRIIGLHVWQKGALSSGSLKAINPGLEGSPTVPAMQAVQAPRSSTPAVGSQPAITVRAPAARSLTPAFGYRSATPGGGIPAMQQTPPGGVAALAPEPGIPASRVTSPAMPTARAPAPRAPATPAVSGSMPAMGAINDLPATMDHESISTPNQPAVSSQAFMAGHPSSAAHRAVTAPPPASATHYAVSAAPVDASPAPSSARMVSGVVPAVETRILRSKSGFMMALEQCQESQGTLVGAALAAPVRDSAAAVLFSVLDAANAWLPDPLSLLDGRVDADTQQGLVGEACVCVSYLLYEALARTSIPQMLAIEVVQSACVQALMGKPMPVSEISRYLATESPREEFTARVCTLLGIRETPDMQKKVEATLRFLRQEVRLCADKVQQRLLKTG
jgi:hypothetical protein